MDIDLVNKSNEVKRELSHLNFNQLNQYLVNRFNLKRIQVEAILIFNRRIFRSDFQFNHLIFAIAVLLLENKMNILSSH